MKKVLLISASVLALSAGAAFAQTTILRPVPERQVRTAPTINQADGGAGTNTSYVYQGYISATETLPTIASASVTQIGGTGTNSSGSSRTTVTRRASRHIRITRLAARRTSGITSKLTTATNANTRQLSLQTSLSRIISILPLRRAASTALSPSSRMDRTITPTVTQNWLRRTTRRDAGPTARLIRCVCRWREHLSELVPPVTPPTVTQSSDYSGIAVTQNGATVARTAVQKRRIQIAGGCRQLRLAVWQNRGSRRF